MASGMRDAWTGVREVKLNVVWTVSRLEGMVRNGEMEEEGTHIHGVRIGFSLSHEPANEGAEESGFCFLLDSCWTSKVFLFSCVILRDCYVDKQP
jgi:hypothetical protein